MTALEPAVKAMDAPREQNSRPGRLAHALPMLVTAAAAVIWSLAAILTFGLRHFCLFETPQACADQASTATRLTVLFIAWAAAHAGLLVAWSRGSRPRVLGAAIHTGDAGVVGWFCISNQAFAVAGLSADLAVMSPFSLAAGLGAHGFACDHG